MSGAGGESAPGQAPFASKLNRLELQSGVAQAFNVNVHSAPPEQVMRHQKPNPEINRTPHNRTLPEALANFFWTGAARLVRRAAPIWPLSDDVTQLPLTYRDTIKVER